MRLIMTSSRWGNLYRFRYYLDGKQVSERVFAKARERGGKLLTMRDSESTDYGYRTVWEFSQA